VGAVLETHLPADLVGLALWMAEEYCSTPARALELMLPPGATRPARGRQALVAQITPSGRAALADGVRLTDGQRAALGALTAGAQPAVALGTALLRRLQARGLVKLERVADTHRPAGRPPSFTVSASAARPPALTPTQAAALQELEAQAAHARGREPLLLHGVTGSGKTELYLRLAQAALDQGRQVIILVPEIALTPQALARLQARFGDTVAVMHSGMGAALRRHEWRRLAHGDARVCVGARSAVFAPLADIGLIVVDEEHEGSYKHEGDPRYDARTVAARRARDHDALLLHGSATPRADTFARARRIVMRERIDGGPLPAVEILDMRGKHTPLHPQARLALADCSRAGGKAVLLLNRRGWSNFLSCGSCGRVWMCPNCEVALVLHRAGGYIACHHCGHREAIPSRCRECGSVSVARHGAGTERLEHELAAATAGERFPVLRLDADAPGLEARARILERFHQAQSGLLIGTQMVAKGHDFPDVGLGIVVDADQTLRFPDFRAEERTFALITQLAGRTGRGGCGRVLVQTTQPSARAIVLAARHDAETFLRGELRRRAALGYPPFQTLIRVVCAAAASEPAHAAARALRELLCADAGAATAVLGPAPLFMLRGRHREQVVVKASDRAAAIAAVRGAVARVSRERSHREVALSVDVDPE